MARRTPQSQVSLKATIAERQEKVWALKRDGASFPQIARQLGISVGTAHSDFTAALAEHQISPTEVMQWREVHTARLERLLMEAVRSIQTATKDQDRIAAIKASVLILERQARLLGLDAPVKVDSTVEVRAVESPDDLARLLGDILAKADQPALSPN